MALTSEKIRYSFLDFFAKKGHKAVSSSSLIPADPSVLLTTAGMQQFKKYYTGELDAQKNFGVQRAVSIQKCFRTSDIDEVGDKTHLTFFEMMGNFAFGDYFKRESVIWAYEYLTRVLEISAERITVSVFGGDDILAVPGQIVPRDEESLAVWREDVGLPLEKIIFSGRQDNFWGPTGQEGPCGPTTEIYVDGVEIWNIVFNEYYCQAGGVLKKLNHPGVDTGMGLERLTSVLQDGENIFETDLFKPLLFKIRGLTVGLDEKTIRVFADHLRAASFLIADGLRPGNKEAAYILRRLLRKVMVYGIKHKIPFSVFREVSQAVSLKYSPFYNELKNWNKIASVIEEENVLFEKALSRGLKELENCRIIDAAKAFYIYETFGLPLELIKELAPAKSLFNFSQKDFDEKFEKHQKISRAGVENKFGGHGLILDTGELKARDENEVKKVIRLHTATHLLQQALRDVLGDEARQAGSDITAERARFDFNFNRKMIAEELNKVEDLVNRKISANLPVSFQEMSQDEAKKTGALHFFKAKYPERVKVYFIAPAGKGIKEAYSKEFCNGPHVKATGEIGGFKIIKEEAVAAGVRRIRAVVDF